MRNRGQVRSGVGKKRAKVVPVRPGRCELRRRMVPLWLRTISSETQRPRPVPVAGLVVKKASKRLRWVSGLMPRAVVGDEDADAGVAGLPVAGAAGAQRELAGAVRHGVEGVGDEVGEDLAEVAGEAEDVVVCGVLAGDLIWRVVMRPWKRLTTESTISDMRHSAASVAWRWNLRVWVTMWETRASSVEASAA